MEPVKQSSKLRSHLPTPVYKLISEKEKFDFNSVRTLLGSALNAEGFGRGSGKLMYKVLENRPQWFDEALENKIGVTWDNFTGVNGVNTKKPVMFEMILAIYRFYLGDS